MSYLVNIAHAPSTHDIGNKARGLKKMQRHHFAVPVSWVIDAEIRKQWKNDRDAINLRLLAELKDLLDRNKTYAVRSSGALEDGTHHSFAGQFTTVLDVQGAANILEAIHMVWTSVEKAFKTPYAQDTEHSDDFQGMAVVIQEMVNVDWSGVAFSINPVTGRFETVIEGVRGSGEQLVQEGITPERWIYHQGTWEEFDRSVAPPQQLLDDLVSGMQKLRKLFRSEVDVEWAWDGTQLWYLQCRSVTTRTFPTIYSNHISREVLPGMIKPLVWSINIPVVNSAWLRLLEGMLGRLDIRPEDLSRSFYYRAYFNMGTLGELFRRMGLPRDSLESLMGRKDPSGKRSFKPGIRTMKYLPRMLWFLLSNLTLGKKFRQKIAMLNEATDALQAALSSAEPMQYRELFDRLHALSREAAYWNIIIPLTMQITNRMLQRKMEKRGKDFSEVDFSSDFPELLQHDPQFHLDALAEKWQHIPESLRSSLATYEDLVSAEGLPDLAEFRKKMLDMLRSFGHFSESGNDFSSEPWRENPGFLFGMIKDRKVHTKGNTHKKKAKGKSLTDSVIAYKRAGRYRLYREMISSTYTRTYGLFRTLFMLTGKYFAARGYLVHPVDVFYLTLEEHDQLLEHIVSVDSNDTNFKKPDEIREKVGHVKSEMARFSDISLPPVVYGETPPPVATPNETMLEGIPVSPGIFEGEIVVVNGYKDFNKQVEGKILVIPFSDVGWTPILTHAGAIVTESGGMLSHASIIARELGIPAISSVDHACSINDGTMARVDGFNGVMILNR